MQPIIGIDAMGGDFGVEATIPAVVRALRQTALAFRLFGREELMLATLAQHTTSAELANWRNKTRLELHDCPEVVTMADDPILAIKQKKASSMRLALDSLRRQELQAVISSGNTGALMAMAKIVIRTVSGVERPAIMSTMPSLAGKISMLDLGANLRCSAQQLYQFALMGSIALHSNNNPRVGILNIGQEQNKGTEELQLAAELIQQDARINYIGFVEGDDIFYKDRADLIVCDGFAGNVALKTAEGLAKMITTKLKAGFTKNWYTKLTALIAAPILRRTIKELNPHRYNGASLLGLRQLVIKSHGGASAEAFYNAILRAEQAMQAQLTEQLISAFKTE